MERPYTFQPPHCRVEQRRRGHFHALPGLDMAGGHAAFRDGFSWRVGSRLAESQGFTYLRATDTVSLLAALDDLLDEAATAPVLLEVFTDAEADAEEQRSYYHAIKERWKNF